MINRKAIMPLVLMVMASAIVIANPVSATSCTDAGDFTGICNTFVGIANGTLAVMSIVFTGSNASIVIEAAIIIAIVTFFWDLSRGENSYIRRRLMR